eukprot:TRINITY_DN14957_c0_g1_i20.p1 TRINITY_DN14957_c0_g1~~TRINITY_DN14957_c0_g1_i20.p1  ORF type:complete len:836 (+),score=109.34 TRINITY_DN14957_c0_g1_i20:98-2605(+)
MLRIGVDIGGTNTDAAVLEGNRVVASAKVPTTMDVISGLQSSLLAVLQDSCIDAASVKAVMVGTTHFINALLTGKSLAPVAIMRLCGTATRDLPPFTDFPEKLGAQLNSYSAMLPGGVYYDGKEISKIDDASIRCAVREAVKRRARAFVVSGVFSPVLTEQESLAADIIQAELTALGLEELSVTRSSTVSGLGLLERENAAILNATLRELAAKVVGATEAAVAECGFTDAGVYWTQNDGTVITSKEAIVYPIRCIACGPVNSLRGAAILSGCEDAIVVDIGGTTTDVGPIVKGFPQPASWDAYIADVRTNFPLPSVHSIAMGGGSIVQPQGADVGPSSVGPRLMIDSLSFGGSEYTATDVALSLNKAPRGLTELAHAHGLEEQPKGRGGWATAAWAAMQRKAAEAIDRCKSSAEDVDVVLVGGGAFLLDETLQGVARLIRPPHGESANAVGAAIAQVSGSVEKILALDEVGERETALEKLKTEAIDKAVLAGAERGTCSVLEIEQVPLAYLPGNTCRVRIRAVGDLQVATSSAARKVDSNATTKDVGYPNATARAVDKPQNKQETSGGLETFVVDPLARSLELATAKQEGSHQSGLSPPLTKDGVWLVRPEDVEALALGVGVLGTGGGGSPRAAQLALLRALKLRGEPLQVVAPGALPDHATVYSCAYMGAPTVMVEMLSSGDIGRAVDALQTETSPKAAAVMTGEIGGGNGLVQFFVALEHGIPVVDGDLMGTAYPQLDHVSLAFCDIPVTPAAIADHQGNQVVIRHAASPKWLEDMLRPVCTSMGCTAALALRPLSGSETKRACIPHTSHTRACSRWCRSVLQRSWSTIPRRC